MFKKTTLFVLLALFTWVPMRASFPDVPMDHWAYDAVAYLAAKGYVEGYPDGEFKGEQMMSRYEWAMVVARLERDLALRFGTGGGGEVPADISGLLSALQAEFQNELEEIRAGIAANEIRIDALSGDIMDLQDAVERMDRRVGGLGSGSGGEGQGFLVDVSLAGIASEGDALGSMEDRGFDLTGSLGLSFTKETGDFLWGVTLATRNDIDLVCDAGIGGAAPGPGCGTDGINPVWANGLGTVWGPITPFRRGGKLVGFDSTTNFQLQEGNTHSNDINFNLHEMYFLWNGRAGAGGGVDIVAGRFEPFWSPSDMSWDTQNGLEGIVLGGRLTESIRFVGGILTDDWAPTGASEDLMTFVQISTEDFLDNINISLGVSGVGVNHSTELSAPELFSLHATIPMADREVFAGLIRNLENTGNLEDTSFEIGTNGDWGSWDYEVAYRTIGEAAGATGAWVPNSEFFSIEMLKGVGPSVDMGLQFSIGELGKDETTPTDRWSLGISLSAAF